MNRVTEAAANGQAPGEATKPRVRVEVMPENPEHVLRLPYLFNDPSRWQDGQRFVMVKRDEMTFELIPREMVVNAETP